MKEEQLAMKEAQWLDDKEVAACRNCEKPFSVSRRKVSTLTALHPFLVICLYILCYLFIYIMLSVLYLIISVSAPLSKLWRDLLQ